MFPRRRQLRGEEDAEEGRAGPHVRRDLSASYRKANERPG